MGVSTMGKKKTDSDMDLENSLILMEVSMKASGSMELWMDMGNFTTLLENLHMKVIGLITNLINKALYIMSSLQYSSKGLTIQTLIT